MRQLWIVALSLSVSACAGPGWFRAHSTGLTPSGFTPCPSPPRCRSSDAPADDERHAIAPLRLRPQAVDAWPAAVRAADALPRSQVVDRRPDYVHLEIVSPWGWYVDDLELQHRPAQGVIAIRSSGRIGWYDFDVNRDRIELLRSALAAEGYVEPAP